MADPRRIVKYHSYLRKMTRYNPTRGGEQYPEFSAVRMSPY